MPITINGSGTLTGLSAGGLPDGSIVQADLAAGVAGNGPAFSACRSAVQTLASATFTKVQFNNELFDTASCYDSSTNYRFTPNVAGYYQVGGCLYISGTNLYNACLIIYKNGSAYTYSSYSSNGASEYICPVYQLVYLNGSTDYVEFFAYGVVSSGNITVAATNTSLGIVSASLTRAA